MTSGLLKPCATCGELTERSRCPEHQPRRRVLRTDTGSTSWKRLARQAKRLQPWCLFCGSTTDLQLDHKPEAWWATVNGKPITLPMVQVTCRTCNVRLGSSQPGSPRYLHWEKTGDDLTTLGGRGDREGAHVRGESKFGSQMGMTLNKGLAWQG